MSGSGRQGGSIDSPYSFAPTGELVVSGAALLPADTKGNVVMREAATPPDGGWTVYLHPPAGTPWPTKIAFFAPLVDPGIPFLKHGEDE